MIGKQALAERFAKGSVDFTSSVIEQALMSDTLRGMVFNELEKYLLTQVKDAATPGLPKRVTEDKLALAQGLIRGADRALERKQISRPVLHKLMTTMLTNAGLGKDQGLKEIRQQFREKHNADDPPATILISPGKSCNLKCVGCYASCAPEEESPRLSWEVFDRILTEAKEMWGLRFFSISGGEPFAYRDNGGDLIAMAEKHDDCFFQVYTNGTLFNEKTADRMAQIGNVIPAISVEGLEGLTDQRRGKGTYQRVLKGMANLRNAGVPFGISLTATKFNCEEILSDEFLDFFFDEQQAIYGWIFQYMPIGRAYSLDLLVSPEQRAWMWKRSWEVVRSRKIMLADFWNFSSASDGCISAAKASGYFYIDWNGTVTPCVFSPYSPVNIHDLYRNGGTLDDVYESPYFEAIRQWQKDYFGCNGNGNGKGHWNGKGNWIMPCPIRDHHKDGRALIEKYNAKPEDLTAAQALEDGQYYEGMLAYDEELHAALDPVWEQEYLGSGFGEAEIPV